MPLQLFGSEAGPGFGLVGESAIEVLEYLPWPAARGKRLRLAGLEQRRTMAATARCEASIARNACRRTSRRVCLLNLLLWRAEHDHRSREAGIQQRKQAEEGPFTDL